MRIAGTLREEDVPEPVMESLLEAFREFSGTGADGGQRPSPSSRASHTD